MQNLLHMNPSVMNLDGGDADTEAIVRPASSHADRQRREPNGLSRTFSGDTDNDDAEDEEYDDDGVAVADSDPPVQWSRQAPGQVRRLQLNVPVALWGCPRTVCANQLPPTSDVVGVDGKAAAPRMQVYYQIPIRSKLGIAQQNGLCYNCSKPIDDGAQTRSTF